MAQARMFLSKTSLLWAFCACAMISLGSSSPLPLLEATGGARWHAYPTLSLRGAGRDGDGGLSLLLPEGSLQSFPGVDLRPVCRQWPVCAFREVLRQGSKVHSALASLDGVARVWLEYRPPRDLEEREQEYWSCHDKASAIVSRSNGRLQRIAQDLEDRRGEGQRWAPHIGTLWRLMSNRLTRLGKIHQIRKDAIYRFWQLEHTPKSRDTIEHLFGTAEMGEEKHEEFQLKSRIVPDSDC